MRFSRSAKIASMASKVAGSVRYMLAQIKLRFEETLSTISQKLTLAEAFRYSLTRWDAMTRYTTDGRLDISNNAAERASRALAPGRRNWTFAGSDSGGERAAIMYSIIETVELNILDPEAFLRALITRINDHPNKRNDELLLGLSCSNVAVSARLLLYSQRVSRCNKTLTNVCEYIFTMKERAEAELCGAVTNVIYPFI